ncbi:MAG: 1,4-alpha-glucan branching protein GlgB [Lachnospiraceae bacterium]|nr:1,4-alpha-glucan branching protein GlgB [Lachnospiraceae bacterium]
MDAKTIRLTKDDCYLFGNGTHYEIYEKLGAHETDGGTYFAVWAPHARSVSVVGDFNDWRCDAAVMQPIGTSGIFEILVPEAKAGNMYKFAITTRKGELIYKADPYARQAQLRPETASVIPDDTPFKWTDDKWYQSTMRTDPEESPMSIYEVHLGSWKKNGEEFKTYRELATELADYVHYMGYTHVEIMGIAEHPFDGSWGYQVTGYYAPTSRYGTPQDFMYMINYLHKKGIGIILDWVPAHFPKDAHGLADFDGEALYEYANPKKGEHYEWGTKVFDYSKYEVSNFLIANALYWIEKFHIDALRVDAVASMLYLDYCRKDGEWEANKYGDNKNLEAIEFFRHLNSIMKQRNPGAMIIAEESTAWPRVTGDPKDGGLGFTYKWNMGWMHDFLEYMKLDPLYRKFNHNKMTFSMTYACSEKYILVLSHDEVVHLKCSMLNKMPGYFVDKFANLKVGYTFFIGHPGKKLLFMGQDFAQLREWSEARELDWYLLSDELHLGVQTYFKNLLHIYRKYPALFEWDNYYDSFEWINCDDNTRSIFSFVRKSRSGKDCLLFICNFTPMERSDYRVGVPCAGNYRLLLDTVSGMHEASDKASTFKAEKQECDGREYSFAYPLAPYGAAVFKFNISKNKKENV